MKYRLENTIVNSTNLVDNLIKLIFKAELPYLSKETIVENTVAGIYDNLHVCLIDLAWHLGLIKEDAIPSIDYKRVDAVDKHFSRHEFILLADKDCSYKFKTYDKFSKHALNIIVDKRGLVVTFSDRITPVNPSVFVYAKSGMKHKVVKGNRLLKHIWNTKYRGHIGGVSSLLPSTLDSSIKANIESLYLPIKTLPYGNALKPALVNHHMDVTIKQALHLASIVCAKRNVHDIRLLKCDELISLEAYELGYNTFVDSGDPTYFVEAAFDRIGKWLEEILDHDYENVIALLRG